MGVVINPVGWRLNVLKYWNFYTWSSSANYSFLLHRFNNFIETLKFYLNNRVQNLFKNENGKLVVRFINIRILQFNNKFIIIIFFETYTNNRISSAIKNIANRGRNNNFLNKFKIETNKVNRPILKLDMIKKKKKLNKIKNMQIKKTFFKKRFTFFKEPDNIFFKEKGYNDFSSKSIRFFSKFAYLPRNYYSFLTKQSSKKYKETLDNFDNSFIWDYLNKATFSKELSLAELRTNKNLSSFFYLTAFSKNGVSFLKRNNYFFSRLKSNSLTFKARIKEYIFLQLKGGGNLERKVDQIFFFFPFFLFLKKFIIRRFKKYISSSSKNLNPQIYFVQNNYSDFNIKYMIDWFLEETFQKKKKFKRTLTTMIKALHYLVDASLIKGYQLQIVGRITKKDRALYIWKRYLNVSLTSKIKKINYYEETFITKFSTCSLKVWVERF